MENKVLANFLDVLDKDTKFSKSEFKSFLKNLEQDTGPGRLALRLLSGEKRLGSSTLEMSNTPVVLIFPIEKIT